MAVDHQTEIARLDMLADLLDSRFVVPGTNIRFGLDAILGLLPVVGDGLAALPAIYLIWRARELGAPRSLVARMIANSLIDGAVGSIPLVGDLFDVGFKSNRRNIALLRRHLLRSPARSGAPQRPDASRMGRVPAK